MCRLCTSLNTFTWKQYIYEGTVFHGINTHFLSLYPNGYHGAAGY